MAIPKQHINQQAYQAGISLVGVLVAAFIIAVGAIAITRLTSTAEKFTGVGREMTVATSLAREGLELIRAVRDNNWFQENTDSTHWLDHGICVTASGEIAHNNRQVIIDPAIVQTIQKAIQQNEVANLSEGTTQLYTSQDGFWTHSGQTPSPYKRAIIIDCSTKNNEPAYITVSSQVTWSSRGQNREVVLKERLYNWLPSRAATNPINP